MPRSAFGGTLRVPARALSFDPPGSAPAPDNQGATTGGGTLPSESLLSTTHHALIADQRALLVELLELLVESRADAADVDTIKASLRQLEQLFLICVVGEFNVGKSTFINALLGDHFLRDGPTPTTAGIWRVNFGEREPHEVVGADGIRTMHCPVPFLRDCQIVDTPGTNVVIDGHRQLTDQFIPQADLVLFLTSADRPFSESERQFLEQIQDWGKKVVFVVNKADHVGRRPQDLREVVDFVRGSAERLLGIAGPMVFTTSAAEALDAKLAALAAGKEGGQPAGTVPLPVSEYNQFLDMERYLFQTLSREDRVKLKLLTPLGVAEAVLEHRAAATAAAQAVIANHVGVLDSVERDLGAFSEDMERDFRFKIDKIDTILLEMVDRAEVFLSENLTVTNIPSLAFGGNALRKAFERNVLQFTTQDIDDHIHGLVDWLISKNDRKSRAVVDFVLQQSGGADVAAELGASTRLQPPPAAVGDVSVVFDDNRRAMLQKMVQQSRDTVRVHSIETESEKLTRTVQQAVAATTVVEAGALGVGALVSLSLLDWTGLTGAGVLAVTGVFILPYQRQRFKDELRRSVTELRESLRGGLTKHLHNEQQLHLERIREGLRPYSQFVEQQTGELRAQAESVRRLEADVVAIRANVDRL